MVEFGLNTVYHLFMRKLILGVSIIFVGCSSGPTAQEKAALQGNIDLARQNLYGRVESESSDLAARSGDTADAIGYVILSNCGREIDALMRAVAADYYATPRTYDGMVLFERRMDVAKRDLEQRVYREAVAGVVRARATGKKE